MSADTTITCRDCGQAFTFTSGEQDFYASRGFSEPSRCADCRAARKAQRDDGGSSYTSYGSSSSYGAGERVQRMHRRSILHRFELRLPEWNDVLCRCVREHRYRREQLRQLWPPVPERQIGVPVLLQWILRLSG